MKKGISLLLVIALVLLLLPTPAYGVATTAAQLEQQIRNTYRKAFQLNHYTSFSGWCATLVNWQTYILGIDTVKYGCDGNGEFDLYSKMSMTTGGYRVKSYPASRYTLKEAFDAITMGGTQDVYNILVGFQKTNTAAGQIYGHACFIHGIVDGKVYFMESYASGIGGRYWAEGEPIVVSIEEFCRYYSAWTVLDGVIYFGLKTYADLCESYPANMDALTVTSGAVMSEPVDAGINDQDALIAATVSRGEILQVTELLKTPGGSWWYAVQNASVRGYLPAENLLPLEKDTVDVSAQNMKVPAALRVGQGFVLSGAISSQSSTIQNVTVTVTAGETVHCTAQVAVGSKYFSLNTPLVDNYMTFRKLPVGTYRLSISAEVTECGYEAGQLVSKTSTVEVWNSEFRIINNYNKYHTVTFDAMGGVTGTDKVAFAAGEAMGVLPTPTRKGYSFAGWYTQKEGGEVVAEGMPVSGDVQLYARWVADNTDYTGWLHTENGWTYLENGSAGNGWFTTGGVSFYRNPDGSIPTGWKQLDGKWYCFNALGAAQTGWVENNEKRYYLCENGQAANGWLQIDEKHYWFTPDGTMLTGWLSLDGASYYLDENGVRVTGQVVIGEKTYSFHEDGRLVTGWVHKDGKTVYLDESGTMVTGWQNIDGKACYFGSDGVLYLTANDSCSYGCLLSTGIGAVQP